MLTPWSMNRPPVSPARWIGALAFCAITMVSSLVSPPGARASTALSGSCLGRLEAVPNTIRIGSQMELKGSHFTCKSSKGKALKTVAVFLYEPSKAFFIYDVRLQHNGTYSARVVVPRQLIAAASLYAGHQKRVSTKPGLYYLGIEVNKLILPPVSQALAKVHLEH